MTRIGMRIETKSNMERRAPLTPNDVRELLVIDGLEIVVQPSPYRVFKDAEYEAAGALISEDISDCDFILGIKEVGIPYLHENKPHLFFSHVIKGQPYNMAMMREILAKQLTLIDYEKVTNDNGMRIIAFSYQAGQAGMVNGLWSMGQRYKAWGIDNPLQDLRQASTYEGGLAEAKAAIADAGKRIRETGVSDDIGPLIIGITGGPGRVSLGAQDVLAAIEPESLTPADLLDFDKRATLRNDRVYQVVYDMPDFLRRTDGNPYDFQDYLANPAEYESFLTASLPYLSSLLNGIYWEERFPKIVTLNDLRDLFAQSSRPKLTVISDVTCDVGGSVESTTVATMPDKPVYVYNPDTDEIVYGFSAPGMQMMTVDILPTEIPRESSEQFGMMLKPFIVQLAGADYSVPFNELSIPAEFKRAVIAHQGTFTPNYEYIQQFLSADQG
jgi:alanine dehydrogenase